MVQVLTESKSAKRYWSDLKRKLAQESGTEQPYEEIVQFKLQAADGKQRETDCAKAEPIKLWLAKEAGRSHRWPTGEFGAMGLEGTVRLGFKKEMEAVPEGPQRQALFDTLLARQYEHCLLYTSPSPRDRTRSRMPSSA